MTTRGTTDTEIQKLIENTKLWKYEKRAAQIAMTMVPGPLSGSRGICFGSHVAPGKYGRGGFCVSPELWIHVAAEKHRGAGEQPT